MVKVSHELPNNMLSMSKDINDYEYCLPHLLDYKGDNRIVGKQTKKDMKSGKATLIKLIGYKKSILFAYKLKDKIIVKLKMD